MWQFNDTNVHTFHYGTSVPAATVQQRRHHQYMQYCYGNYLL